jgi:DNA invertase Pin-like site-specific DNA recombinase/uncharacterized protein YueI
MKSLFGYVRVSTAKQGQHGVSLQEQRDAIVRFAQRFSLGLTEWFEERETAAKRGRPVFSKMLKLLRQGKADGVIIHKIDRGARNLKDWADLGELIDHGIEVHFANEGLDLHSRGGRLSADIQAVVAADFIRNLREETRKGFYGRIKQGLYPLPAPLGYLDKGGGRVKEADPSKAPLVRKAFELYGSTRYNLDGLVEEMARLGLRNRKEKRVTRNGMSRLLNNPFYLGLIRLQSTGETFPGSHQPLITKSLYERVQNILNGRTNTRTGRHQFLFRRLLKCRRCGYSAIAEEHKNHVYYRCQSVACAPTCIREEIVEQEMLRAFGPLRFTDEERVYLKAKVAHLKETWQTDREAHVNALRLSLGSLHERLNRLTDAFIDGTIEKDLFERRKTGLLLEQKQAEESLRELQANGHLIPDRLSEFLELAGSAYFQYKLALPEEKRDLLQIVTSNRWVQQKNVEVTLAPAFREVANRLENSIGSPYRDIPRTLDGLLERLLKHFTDEVAPAN